MSTPPPKKRILVAEDESELNDIYTETLTNEGFEVVQSDSGAGAASRLESAAFDGLVSDIHMPGLNGIDIARVARKSKLNANILIILVSGRIDVDAAETIKSLNIKDVFVKPVSPQIIVDRLKLRLKPAAAAAAPAAGNSWVDGLKASNKKKK